jgi:hypothetical protein
LFITFSLARQRAELRTEFAGDFRRIDQRLDGVEQRLGTVEQRLGTVEQRLGHLEDFNRRVEAHHEATRLILSDILDRLPARRG